MATAVLIPITMAVTSTRMVFMFWSFCWARPGFLFGAAARRANRASRHPFYVIRGSVSKNRGNAGNGVMKKNLENGEKRGRA